jgi:hypothetical protein
MSLARYLLKKRSPAPIGNEVRLFHEVRRAYPGLDYADLTSEALARIVRERGIDFATALLYDRIRRSSEHGPFIREMESLEPDLAALPRLSGKVLVAPAAFYREYPEFAGDGLLVREIAAEFGLEAEVLPVRSTGSVRENAAIIRETLFAERCGSVVLVSLSKGAADARLALEGAGPAVRKVRVWLQIGGMPRGSPMADSLLGRRGWGKGLLHAYLAATGVRMDTLRELSHGPGSLLSAPVAVPRSVPVINVIGFPLASHLGVGARVRHARLAPLGPNDGTTLLRDAILEPGRVYPVWGADHYFRAPEVSRLLYRLFLYLARSGLLQAPPTPALSLTGE